MGQEQYAEGGDVGDDDGDAADAGDGGSVDVTVEVGEIDQAPATREVPDERRQEEGEEEGGDGEKG